VTNRDHLCSEHRPWLRSIPIANRRGSAAAVVLLLSLSLAGYGRGAEAAPAARACAPAPLLALTTDFADPRAAFAPGAAAFRRTQANFAAAYRRACARGLLRRPLIDRGAGRSDRLLLKNATDANVASIYLDGEDGAPPTQRRMVLEYPFLTADGAPHVPSANDLAEAIFCAVHGATQQEEEDSGRCLPD
jgi:hypothetical protein